MDQFVATKIIDVLKRQLKDCTDEQQKARLMKLFEQDERPAEEDRALYVAADPVLDWHLGTNPDRGPAGDPSFSGDERYAHSNFRGDDARCAFILRDCRFGSGISDNPQVHRSKQLNGR